MSAQTQPTLPTLRPVAADPLARSIERYFSASLLAMVVVGFVALAGTGKLDLLTVLLVALAFAAKILLLANRREFSLDVKTTTRLTWGYILFYLFDLVTGTFVSATVHLVLFVMVVKLFSVQSERDHLYLSVISFLMVLSAAILTVDSFFLIAFTIFLLLTVTTFITMEMRRSLRAAQLPLRPDDEEADRRVGVLTNAPLAADWIPKSLSNAAVTMVLAMAVGATVIFFALPRRSTNYLTSLSARNVFVSGFSDRVNLGDIGRIQQTDAVVMHVQFKQPEMVQADFKWRGVGLSFFDGKKWFNTTMNRSDRLPATFGGVDLVQPKVVERLAGVSRFGPGESYGTIKYRVMLQPIGTNSYFLLHQPVRLEANAREFVLDNLGGLFTNDPSRQIQAYSATSILRRPTVAQQQSASVEFPEAISRPYLQLPPLDPRVKQLADTVTANSPTVYAKARAIEEHLRSKFGYSLDMKTPTDGSDPLSFFLFTRKQGHCEYFATAMAIMLRSLGIPSRVVNGFRNGEFNDITGSYIVRAKDAHSWVEVFVPEYGWVEFDPTPAAESADTGGWGRMRMYVDAMREFWSEWVVNYDFTHQDALAATTASRSRKIFDASRSWVIEKYKAFVADIRELQHTAQRDPRTWGMRLLFGAGLIGLLLNLNRLREIARSFRLARKPASAPKAAATLWYQRFLRSAEKRGRKKRAAQTASEFAAEFPAGESRKVIEFTEHYERARFGGSAVDAERLPQLFEEVDELLKK